MKEVKRLQLKINNQAYTNRSTKARNTIKKDREGLYMNKKFNGQSNVI